MKNNTRGLSQFKTNALSDNQMNAVTGGAFSLTDLSNFLSQAQKFVAATKSFNATISFDKNSGKISTSGVRNGQAIKAFSFTLPSFLTSYINKNVTGIPSKINISSADTTKPAKIAIV